MFNIIYNFLKIDTIKRGGKMSKNELKWGIASVLLILLAYIIPYTILTDVAMWYGSFFLWIVIALIIILVNFIVTSDWRS